MPNADTANRNKYYLQDARELSVLLDPATVDATITSPPYWDVKDYGSPKQLGFGQSYESYLNDVCEVFNAVWDATKATGSLWIIVDTIKKDGHVHLLPFDLASRLESSPGKKWHLQDILIWQKPHTLPWSHAAKLQGQFEYILCFSKSKRFTLNVEKIRSTDGLANWWVKYPERYHPLGKSVGNVWEFSIPTQGQWGNGHFRHACPLPVEMLQRMILLSTKSASDVVLDPFAGTGATLIAAESLGRSSIGFDLNRAFKRMYVSRRKNELPDQAAASFVNLKDTNLKLRQLKYAVQLYKRIAPAERLTTTDVPLLIVKRGNSVNVPNPVWVSDCKTTLVVSDHLTAKRRDRLKLVVESARKVPPLSKFQIDGSVEIVSKSKVAEVLATLGSSVSRYTQGRFWQATSLELHNPIRKRVIRLPDLLSDICVDERPAF